MKASLALSDWILQNKTFCFDKNILELGSGAGLLGLIVVKFTEAQKMVFSDCHLSVLQLLQENVKMNIDAIERVVDNHVLLSGRNDGMEVAVLNLPWETVDEDLRDSVGADVVLAADVVYDSSLFPSLTYALKCLLSNKSCTAIIACTERNKATLENFLYQLS